MRPNVWPYDQPEQKRPDAATLDNSDEELAAAMERVAKLLRERSERLPPEFQKPLYDNLWDLYERPGICPACRAGGVCGCILNVPKVT